MSQSSNNKRIAKNTIYLYIRMLLVMGITLYTSRVILQVLGVTDFGIYNVVGGMATSFAFFSSSLSNSTQRFLNVELGKNDIAGVNKIFNLSLLLYMVIIILVIIVAESVGIWLIYNKLVIPAERMLAAQWVFHTTIIGLAITLISSVFDSVLIARENMKIYAYISIIEVLLKLFIVYFLALVNFDKLQLYAVLFLFSHMLVKSISVIYCIRNYPECKFRLMWDTSLFGRMFRFIGWNGVGTAVYTINDQGINVLLNMFFGPVVNAARGVSAQVGSAVNNFSMNFYTAFRPQIVKSYSGKDYDYFIKLINISARYSFFLMWLLCLPIMLRSEGVLQLWLKEVPDYAPKFVQWILLYQCVNVLTNPFWSGVQAIGNLKGYIMIGSSVFLLAFPISYIFLKFGWDPLIVFQVLVFVRLAYLFVTIFIFRSMIEFSIADYLKKVIVPIVKVSLLSGIILLYIEPYFSNDLWGIVAITAASVIITLLCICMLGTSVNERTLIKSKIHNFINR